MGFIRTKHKDLEFRVNSICALAPTRDYLFTNLDAINLAHVKVVEFFQRGIRTMDTIHSKCQPASPAVSQSPASTLVVGAKKQRYSSPPHADQGIVGDLIDLITVYFDEYATAILRHPGAASIAEVRELRQLKGKFKTMFSKNRGSLDHRLAQAERVRKPLVMNFIAIVLSFHRGKSSFTFQIIILTISRDKAI